MYSLKKFLQFLCSRSLVPFFHLASYVRKIIRFLFKYNQNLLYAYDTGVFYFYWSISWLIIRFTMKVHLMNLLFKLDSLVGYSVQVISVTLFSMGVAFLGAVMIGLFGFITAFVQKCHMNLLFHNPYWSTYVVTLRSFHMYLGHTRVRRATFILAVLLLFMLNFFSFGLLSYYFLTLWLGFLYTFIYFNRVVYVIFPTTETTYKMVDGIDGDLYDDALYKYYGVKRPKNFYSGPRRNPKA